MTVEPKITDSKLRSGVNWQGALKQKGLEKAFVFFADPSPSRKKC